MLPTKFELAVNLKAAIYDPGIIPGYEPTKRLNEYGLCYAATVRSWPIATGDILTASRRFRGIADMAGVATGQPQSRMTRTGHRVINARSD
jgi:hypothetical protein